MNSKIKINNHVIPIKPLLIFQRICLNVTATRNMEEFLRYELAPFPLSIFDESGLRKTNKSAFIDNFKTIENPHCDSDYVNVVDGGFFIHQISWSSNESTESILKKYIHFAKKNCKPNSIFVFDGYESMGTKYSERCRRQKICPGREISVAENTIIPISSKEFLTSDKNKKKLIDLLVTKLHLENFRTKVATEDADLLIIETARKEARFGNKVQIIGNDTDLLIILSQLERNNENIVFKVSTNSKNPNRFYGGDSFKIKSLQEIVAFLYIFTGCDTTSAFFSVGKNKILQCLPEEKLIELARPYYDPSATQENIIYSGIEIIRAMYMTEQEKRLEIKKETCLSLSDIRYKHFQRSTTKKKSEFKLETLPPTEGAAAQHCLRSFLQLQTWLGNELDPLKFGWKVEDDRFLPVYSAEELIPPAVAETVSCNCKTGCEKNSCGCRKHGLKCTTLCGNCYGELCANAFCVTDNVEANDNFEENENDDDVLNGLLDEVVNPETEEMVNVEENYVNSDYENFDYEDISDDLETRPAKKKKTSV